MIPTRRRTTAALSLALALIVTTVLTGCAEPAGTEAASPAPSASATPRFDPDATLWSISSTEDALGLDDPDVQALQQVVALHSGASDNRSPATVAESVTAEEMYFTPLFSEKLAAQGYRDAVVAMYDDADLTIEQTGVAWLQSTIDADRLHATVGFESLFAIVEASEGYLHELDVDPGAEFAQPREYSLTKVDGVWLIDDISKGPLRKSAEPTP